MLKYIWRYINPPKAEELAAESLEEHKRLLLREESQAAYHAKMSEYYRESIDRLTGYSAAIPK